MTTPTPIFVQQPLIGVATLTAPAAITSRAVIAGVTGLVQLTPVPATVGGKRVDYIRFQAKGTTVAGILFVWYYDGTNSYLIAEQLVTAITPSTTVAAWTADLAFPLGFNLGGVALPRLYISSTISQDFNAFAFGGDY